MSRGWLIVAGGSSARLALGLVVSVVTARALGPTAFGIYAVLAATGNIAAGIADFGLTGAAVRGVANSWPASRERTQRVWRVFFWLRVTCAGSTAIAGAVFAGPIAEQLLGLAGRETLVRLTLVGVTATALSGAVAAMLQATRHFGRLSLVMLTNATVTTILAIALDATGALNLTSALLALGIAPSLASLVAGFRLLPGSWSVRFPDRRSLRLEGPAMARFGSWLWIGSLLAILAAQLDVMLVNRWSAPAAVGAYALALGLATKADVVNQSLYAVLLPTASALDDPQAVRQYLRRGWMRSAAIVAALLPLFPASDTLIPALYGPDYEPAVGLFRGLLCVAIVDIFATPILLLAFSWNQPPLLTACSAARLGTLAGVGAWLIPTLGPAGAVVAKLCASLVVLLAVLAALARHRLAVRHAVIDSA